MNNETLNQSEKPSEIKYFYFEKDGKIIGPTEDRVFYELIKKSELPHETLIWEVGKQQWEKLGECYKNQNLPPLPLSHITNGFAITIAFMPFLQVWIAKYFNASFRGELISLQEYHSTLFFFLACLYFFITVNIFLIADIVSLERKNVKFGKAVYLFGNIVPTYLFYRGTVLAKASGKSWHVSHLLAFVWIVSANYAFGLGIF